MVARALAGCGDREFAVEARPKPNAQLALMLLLYTGQRASDVVRIRWNDYDGSGIAVRQLKTGTPLWIRCHTKLKIAPDHAPRLSEFILTNRYGNGYTAGGLCDLIAMATAQIGAKDARPTGCAATLRPRLRMLAVRCRKSWQSPAIARSGKPSGMPPAAIRRNLPTGLCPSGSAFHRAEWQTQEPRGNITVANRLRLFFTRWKRTFSRRGMRGRKHAPARTLFGRIIFFFRRISHSI